MKRLFLVSDWIFPINNFGLRLVNVDLYLLTLITFTKLVPFLSCFPYQKTFVVDVHAYIYIYINVTFKSMIKLRQQADLALVCHQISAVLCTNLHKCTYIPDFFFRVTYIPDLDLECVYI